jgi:16S rRNA (cytosine967-C5)-methyltransferase
MSKTRSAARLRAEAAKVVDAVVVHGRSLDGALEAHESSVDPADQPMVRMLCYGTLRNHFRLRADVAKLLDRPLKARDSV